MPRFSLPRADATQAELARGRATGAEQHDGELHLERRLRADRMGGAWRGGSRLTPAPYPSAPAHDDDAEDAAELSAAAHDAAIDQFVASYQAGEWVGYPAAGSSTTTPHPLALPSAARSSSTTNDSATDERSRPWTALLTDAHDNEHDEQHDTAHTAHMHTLNTTDRRRHA